MRMKRPRVVPSGRVGRRRRNYGENEKEAMATPRKRMKRGIIKVIFETASFDGGSNCSVFGFLENYSSFEE